MDNIHLIQLSGYDRPVITEERNQNWVGIGENNDYYETLINAFMDSTTNNAVINGIVNQIYGKGLDATDSNRKPDQYAQMRGLLKPKDLRRVCQDLKLLGEGSFQVTYKGNQIDSITHFPRETLRAEKVGEDGEIKNYLYSPDWAKVKQNSTLKKFPVFGSGAKNEIFIVRRYVTGYYYYSPADYQTSYATLEREIADYLINDTMNGFSGTKIVNFNNGVPDPKKQDIIKSQVLNKLTGSHGEKVIVAFNDNAESKTTVEDVPLNDAPAHYSYLSEECKKMIMLTHRVTSPLLLGLSSANGFSSNADEIINASNLFNNIVIKPYQHLIIDALDEMFAVNGISLNLYFKTIEPLEFMEIDEDLDSETIEEETGVKVEDEETIIDEYRSQLNLKNEDLTDEHYNLVLENLEGEVIGDEWEVAAEREYTEEVSDSNKWAENLVKVDFAETIDSNPSKFSILDKSYYKIRFKYVRGSNKAQKYESRPFCKAMMQRTTDKVVYRIEDIDKASGSLAFEKAAELPLHKGRAYDLFKFKGGVYCRHKWVQVLYKLKVSALNQGKEGSEDIKDYKVTSKIPKSARRSPAGSKKAKIAPVNMPNNGHYPK